MWELDHKEGWASKNWCFWTVVLKKTLESPLDWKEINRDYSLEGLMLKLKLQYFGHLMQRADSLEKNPDTGKNWGQEEKGVTEIEMVGWHSMDVSLGNSGKWWRTRKPGVLQFVGSQRVGQDLAIEQTTKNEEFSWHISSTHSVQPVCILKKTRWFLPPLKLPQCWIEGHYSSISSWEQPQRPSFSSRPACPLISSLAPLLYSPMLSCPRIFPANPVPPSHALSNVLSTEPSLRGDTNCLLPPCQLWAALSSGRAAAAASEPLRLEKLEGPRMCSYRPDFLPWVPSDLP